MLLHYTTVHTHCTCCKSVVYNVAVRISMEGTRLSVSVLAVKKNSRENKRSDKLVLYPVRKRGLYTPLAQFSHVGGSKNCIS